MSLPITVYLILAGVLFTLGALTVLLRRNAIIELMGVELMLNSVNLVLVTFSRIHGNLTGQVFVNQTAAFSDFHGTGANPAANAAYADAAFISNRFRVVTTRRHV